MIKNLKDIPLDIENAINWNITPEEAIGLHLEWGPLRNQSFYHDNSIETVYFCIDNWVKRPTLILCRRKGFDLFEIGKFDIPQEYIDEFNDMYKWKGIYELSDNLKNYIKKEMGIS